MGVIAIESQDYDGVASTQDVFDSWGKYGNAAIADECAFDSGCSYSL